MKDTGLIPERSRWSNIPLVYYPSSMNVTQTGRLIGFGILTWLLPFLLSLLFYSPEGVPLSDVFLIKTILLVFSTALGVALILVYFGNIHAHFVREGILLGIVWLLINWVLDILILLPLAGMDVGTYMAQVGARYLNIPIIAVGIGYAAEQAVRVTG